MTGVPNIKHQRQNSWNWPHAFSWTFEPFRNASKNLSQFFRFNQRNRALNKASILMNWNRGNAPNRRTKKDRCTCVSRVFWIRFQCKRHRLASTTSAIITRQSLCRLRHRSDAYPRGACSRTVETHVSATTAEKQNLFSLECWHMSTVELNTQYTLTQWCNSHWRRRHTFEHLRYDGRTAPNVAFTHVWMAKRN